jgi:uncharacterized Zn finger protein
VRRSSPVGAASIFCDVCQEATPHRILSLRGPRPAAGSALSGIARCQRCRLTHPFGSPARRPCTVRAIVSEGPVSRSLELRLPAAREVGIGGKVLFGREQFVVRRIELAGQRSAAVARPEEIACLWVTNDRGFHVPISIVEGRRTRSIRWTPPGGARVGVGDSLSLDGNQYIVTGIRSGGRTLRRASGSVDASSIERIYVRRTWNPPAGSSDWSRSRETPSSRESSRSRSLR